MPNELVNVEEGVQLHQRLLELKQNIGLGFIEVGMILYRLKEEKLYAVINPDMSWEAYCSMPEVSISPSHARNLMRIYKRFILELHVRKDVLAKIDQRKLTAIVPVVDERNVEDMLAQADTLSRADLIKTLKYDADHECKWEAISFERCSICYDERNRRKARIE